MLKGKTTAVLFNDCIDKKDKTWMSEYFPEPKSS